MQVSSSFKKRVESELERLKTQRDALQKKLDKVNSTIDDMQIVLEKIEDPAPTTAEEGVEERLSDVTTQAQGEAA